MRNPLFLIPVAVLLAACSSGVSQNNSTRSMSENSSTDSSSTQVATFGAGCFWCVEAIFKDLRGVTEVRSGYTGGTVKNPSYKEVCTGETGHAEAIEVHFDPAQITYAELIEAFFEAHDPTTLNRQGADVGTQYRSAIFYHNEEQKALAELAIRTGNESGNWPDPIVTEVTEAGPFYVAEDYHQDYFDLHGEQPYCQIVIAPKVEKFRKKFREKLKSTN